MPEKTLTLKEIERANDEGRMFVYSSAARFAAKKWEEALKYGHVKPNKDVPPDCVKGVLWFCEHFFKE